MRLASAEYPLTPSDNDPAALATANFLDMAFGSAHPGICQFAMCDGSVVAYSTSTNPTVLGYLANRDDGQVIDTNLMGR